MKIYKYNEMPDTKIFESNLSEELSKSGYSNEEIQKMISFSKETKLGAYMTEHGTEFTFGILNAIYLDIESNKFKTDLFKNIFKVFYRSIPNIISWILPVFNVVGMTVSLVRGTNKVIAPIVENPGKNYPEFLKKFLSIVDNVSEGELPINDPLRKAFLLSDNIIKLVNPNVIHRFIYHLSNKMSQEDSRKRVPDNYVEDEFRLWVKEQYNITIS